MKKIIALFAVLAASSLAQAQTVDHPNARNDRTPLVQAADHGDSHDARRAHRRHVVRHHHRKHHHRM